MFNTAPRSFRPARPGDSVRLRALLERCQIGEFAVEAIWCFPRTACGRHRGTTIWSRPGRKSACVRPSRAARSCRPVHVSRAREPTRSGETDLRRKLANVHPTARTERPGRRVASRGAPQQILIPGHLFRRAVREKQRAEHLAERRIRRRPARADRGDDGVLNVVLAADSPSARIPAVQDEIRYTVRVPRCVRDGDRRSLGDAEQREPLQPTVSMTVSRSPTQTSTEGSPMLMSESPARGG